MITEIAFFFFSFFNSKASVAAMLQLNNCLLEGKRRPRIPSSGGAKSDIEDFFKEFINNGKYNTSIEGRCEESERETA